MDGGKAWFDDKIWYVPKEPTKNSSLRKDRKTNLFRDNWLLYDVWSVFKRVGVGYQKLYDRQVCKWGGRGDWLGGEIDEACTGLEVTERYRADVPKQRGPPRRSPR